MWFILICYIFIPVPKSDYHITLDDISGTTINGDLPGTIVGTPTLVSGQVGQAVLVGYNEAYMDFGSHSSTCLTDLQLCNGGLSITMWANFHGKAWDLALLTTGGAMKIQTRDVTSFFVILTCGSREVSHMLSFYMEKNIWHHFTFICDDSAN